MNANCIEKKYENVDKTQKYIYISIVINLRQNLTNSQSGVLTENGHCLQGWNFHQNNGIF